MTGKARRAGTYAFKVQLKRDRKKRTEVSFQTPRLIKIKPRTKEKLTKNAIMEVLPRFIISRYAVMNGMSMEFFYR